MKHVYLLFLAALFVTLFPWRDAQACTSATCFTAVNGTASSTFTIFSGNNDAIDASTPGSGIGVNGTSDSSPGVQGNSTSGSGVYGTSENGSGVKGVITGSGGYGVYGVGNSYGNGVYGTSSGSDAVKGVATDATNAGVSGTQSGAGGYGVWGDASSSSGGTGVKGIAAYSSTLYAGNAGVYGSNTAGGWAGYFDGPVYIPTNDLCNPTCGSDARLKQNIEPLRGVLDRLLQLHGVNFEWKNVNPAIGRLPGTRTGLIAQDVEKVFPSWVGQDSDGFKTLGIEQREAFALTVEALRELKAENDALKARMQAVEDARRPLISYNPNWGIAMAGLIIGGAIFFSRRKRSDSDKA